MNKTEGACNQHPDDCPEDGHRTSNEQSMLQQIRDRDAISAETWFKGPGNGAARAFQDRRWLLAYLDKNAERSAHETGAPKPCRVCDRHHEPPECSVAWLIEDGASPPRYRTADGNGFGWTLDVNKAIRLVRRCDAEMLAAADDAAWRIVEHMWCSSSLEPTHAQVLTGRQLGPNAAPVSVAEASRDRQAFAPAGQIMDRQRDWEISNAEKASEFRSEATCSWGCHYVYDQFIRYAACTVHGASVNGSG